MPKKRNPNNFTTDEAQTATLILTEGYMGCLTAGYKHRGKTYRYRYPGFEIRMCDREALQPAARLLGKKITEAKQRKPTCPTHISRTGNQWLVREKGRRADQIIQRLKPLLTTTALQRWEKTKQRCPI